MQNVWIIIEFFYFPLALSVFAGSCLILQRTSSPPSAAQRDEPSTWPGPRPLTGTARSSVTSWRCQRTVSFLACGIFLPLFSQFVVHSECLCLWQMHLGLCSWPTSIQKPLVRSWGASSRHVLTSSACVPSTTWERDSSAGRQCGESGTQKARNIGSSFLSSQLSLKLRTSNCGIQC